MVTTSVYVAPGSVGPVVSFSTKTHVFIVLVRDSKIGYVFPKTEVYSVTQKGPYRGLEVFQGYANSTEHGRLAYCAHNALRRWLSDGNQVYDRKTAFLNALRDIRSPSA